MHRGLGEVRPHSDKTLIYCADLQLLRHHYPRSIDQLCSAKPGEISGLIEKHEDLRITKSILEKGRGVNVDGGMTRYV